MVVVVVKSGWISADILRTHRIRGPFQRYQTGLFWTKKGKVYVSNGKAEATQLRQKESYSPGPLCPAFGSSSWTHLCLGRWRRLSINPLRCLSRNSFIWERSPVIFSDTLRQAQDTDKWVLQEGTKTRTSGPGTCGFEDSKDENERKLVWRR